MGEIRIAMGTDNRIAIEVAAAALRAMGQAIIDAANAMEAEATPPSPPEPAVVEEPRPRRKVVNFYKRPDPIDVRRILDMCAAGHRNREIADETGVSAATVCRIRGRNGNVRHLWPAIDMWRMKNPRADLQMWRRTTWRRRSST